ncbi:MAG: glycerate kinase [Microthrixaceae bacterium]
MTPFLRVGGWTDGSGWSRWPASGLGLLGERTNDPVAASTIGTGELIHAALGAGAPRILVGVGGSASTDGGLGALDALGAVGLGSFGRCEVEVACDVRTRFLDAADEFAPQKGATPAQTKLLRRRLRALHVTYLERFGVDVSAMPGSGAAGGLAGGLAAAGADLASGFEVVAAEADFDAHLDDADLVVTGEGLLDDASFDGKVVGSVIERARQVGVPVLVVVGARCDHDAMALVEAAEDVQVVELVESYGAERAHREAAALIGDAVTMALRSR